VNDYDAYINGLHNEIEARGKRIAGLEAEVKEARNEAATVRRAYLHERSRADKAVEYLLIHDRSNAEALKEHAYKGPSDTSCGEPRGGNVA
jgi:hypothetical protein